MQVVHHGTKLLDLSSDRKCGNLHDPVSWLNQLLKGNSVSCEVKDHADIVRQVLENSSWMKEVAAMSPSYCCM